MAEPPTPELAQAIESVTEKAQLLVREEIALAKAEMTQKVTRLVRGAAIGAAAGLFAVFGLIYLLHSLSWLLYRIISDDGRSVWIGYIIVAVALFILGGLAAFIAARSLKRAVPPTPAMAIEEAQLIRETISNPRPATPAGAGLAEASGPAAPEGRPR